MVLLEDVVADYFFNDPDDNKVILAKLYTHVQISKAAEHQIKYLNNKELNVLNFAQLMTETKTKTRPFER